MTIDERARKIALELSQLEGFHACKAQGIIAAELRAVQEEVELRGGYNLKDVQKSYRRGLLRAAEIAECYHDYGAEHAAERIRKEAGA